MRQYTSADCSDSHPNQLAMYVRRYQAFRRVLAITLDRKQQEELRQEQRKVISSLYCLLEGALREQAQHIINQAAQHSCEQPVRENVRTDVLHSMVANSFTTLIGALDTFELDGATDLQTRLLALVRTTV